MWSKIYLIALAVALLIMAALTYISYSWLQSITKPSDVVANYEYYSSLLWTSLFISSVILLIISNIKLWLTRGAWTLWATLGYFSVFALLQTWWLNNAFLSYQKSNGLTESTFSFLGLGGTMLCIIVGVGIFFDQFLVLKMRDRIHGVNKPTETVSASKELEDKDISELETLTDDEA